MCAVYVIAPEDGEFSKIGISDMPGARLAQLQTGNWVPLHLHAAIWVYNGHAPNLEAACHFTARQRQIEIRGEWVRLSPDLALEMVLETAAILGVEATSTEGVELAKKDETAARAHVMKRIRQEDAQRKAACLGY
jgi:hypothetical protein